MRNTGCSTILQEMGTKILQAGLALHEKVSASFRKTAVNFHYEFTVRAAAHTPCGPNN